MPFVILDGGHHLPSHGVGVHIHQGQEPVGRPAGHDLELAHVLETLEAEHEVFMVFLFENVLTLFKLIEVMPRGLVKLGEILRADDFLLRKLDEGFEVMQVAVLKERVCKHISERRSKRHRDPEIETFAG
jgi:hypothetical protein